MYATSRTIYAVTASNRYIRLEEYQNLRVIGVQAFDAAEEFSIGRAQHATLVDESLLKTLEVLAVLSTYYSHILVSGQEWRDKTWAFCELFAGWRQGVLDYKESAGMDNGRHDYD